MFQYRNIHVGRALPTVLYFKVAVYTILRPPHPMGVSTLLQTQLSSTCAHSLSPMLSTPNLSSRRCREKVEVNDLIVMCLQRVAMANRQEGNAARPQFCINACLVCRWHRTRGLVEQHQGGRVHKDASAHKELALT